MSDPTKQLAALHELAKSCPGGVGACEWWVDVLGTDGRYEVSSRGRVRSKWSNSNNRPVDPSRVLSPGISIDGYVGVKLAGKSKRVHRLVAVHFVPRPAGTTEVNHRNGNKLDNRAENLEWCTRSHNQRHALVNGLKPNLTRLSPMAVRVIRRLTELNMSQIDIADVYGVSRKTVYNAMAGRTWKYAPSFERKKECQTTTK